MRVVTRALERTRGRNFGDFRRRRAKRSTSAQVLVAALPRWPLSRDCITVWLRTRICPVVFEREDGDDDESDEPSGWADVPAAERLDPDCAAPCARHLLAKPPSYY